MTIIFNIALVIWLIMMVIMNIAGQPADTPIIMVGVMTVGALLSLRFDKLERPIMTKILTFDEFVNTYKPIDNTIDTTRGHDGKMFEVSGSELIAVQAAARADPDKVWTLLDDGDSACICPGYSTVNRQGYFICLNPFYNYEVEVEL